MTGGRNGYGAKLANIFSKEFTVETSDSSVGKKYKQTFRENMTKRGEPQIKDCKEDWTKISFIPDFAKFGMEGLDDDMYSLLERRTYDLAGVSHHSVKVWLNGKRLAINNFSNYVDLYLGPKVGGTPRVSEKVADRWEVAVGASDDGFQQVSFVNSIATTKGGTHVAHVVDQVVEKVLAHLIKKHKCAAAAPRCSPPPAAAWPTAGPLLARCPPPAARYPLRPGTATHSPTLVVSRLPPPSRARSCRRGLQKTLKPAHIKAHLKIFINCLVENPAFDSQTKENMTLKQSAFGSKCALSDKFFKDVLNCGVLESVLDFAQSKQNKELKKTDGAKKARRRPPPPPAATRPRLPPAAPPSRPPRLVR